MTGEHDRALPRDTSLLRTLSELQLVVFDVDGTLYDQSALRHRMLLLLARHLMLSVRGWRTLRVIRTFRKTREHLADEEAAGVGELQYRAVASQLKLHREEVACVTNEWLERRPLPLLARHREPGVADLFQALRARHIPIAVLSDYPAMAKLGALGLEADVVVTATDRNVDRFKPATDGLQHILQRTGVAPGDCLVIGDREDRDGECARRLGARFLLKVRRRPRAAGEFRDYAELSRALTVEPQARPRSSLAME